MRMEPGTQIPAECGDTNCNQYRKHPYNPDSWVAYVQVDPLISGASRELFVTSSNRRDEVQQRKHQESNRRRHRQYQQEPTGVALEQQCDHRDQQSDTRHDNDMFKDRGQTGQNTLD